MSVIEVFSLLLLAWGVGGLLYNCILSEAGLMNNEKFLFYQGWALTITIFGIAMFLSYNLGYATAKDQAVKISRDEAVKTAEKE
jgi:hypothetical protein